MSQATLSAAQSGLLSANEIEDIVTQLVREEVTLHQEHQKLKIAQERAMAQAMREREEHMRLLREQALFAYGQAPDAADEQNFARLAAPSPSATKAPVASHAGAEAPFRAEKAALSQTASFECYEAVASEYVSGKSFKERIAAITKGVKNVLSERLNVNVEDMMSDMPVIQRADGSVGDIGESWWDASLEALDKKTEEDLTQMALTFETDAEYAGAEDADFDRSAALEVSGFDWLEMDEPSGLEQDTQFLSFRAPGGHPEVSDTSTYVNYLVEDELKSANNPLLKKHMAAHLRVIEGGSGRIKKAM